MSDKVAEANKPEKPAEPAETKLEPKELEQIMSEIDALQGKMEAIPESEPEVAVAAAPPAPKTPEVKAPETWEEDTISQMKPEQDDLGREIEAFEARNHGNASGNSDTLGSAGFSLTLQGRISVQLKYEDGEEVTAHFGPDGIRFKFGDGLEFKVPSRQVKLKKVA